jgi:hypothetical protein
MANRKWFRLAAGARSDSRGPSVRSYETPGLVEYPVTRRTFRVSHCSESNHCFIKNFQSETDHGADTIAKDGDSASLQRTRTVATSPFRASVGPGGIL